MKIYFLHSGRGFILQSGFDYVQQVISFCVTGKKIVIYVISTVNQKKKKPIIKIYVLGNSYQEEKLNSVVLFPLYNYCHTTPVML